MDNREISYSTLSADTKSRIDALLAACPPNIFSATPNPLRNASRNDRDWMRAKNILNFYIDFKNNNHDRNEFTVSNFKQNGEDFLDMTNPLSDDQLVVASIRHDVTLLDSYLKNPISHQVFFTPETGGRMRKSRRRRKRQSKSRKRRR
jgi:hypothetical protein